MRDLLMLAAMLFWIPLAFGDAFVAYLLWEWLAIVSPAYFLFGFMGNIRYGLVFAGIAVLLMLIGRANLPGRFSSTRTGNLMILLLIHASLCAALAYDPNPLNFDVYSNFAKTLVFVLLMPLFVADRSRLHAMLIMIALAVGFHGLDEGLKVLVTAGGHNVRGIPTSILSDNNHFAIGIAMGIPVLYYLYQYSERKLARFGFLAVMLVTLAAVIGTRSRGGFIAIGAVAIFLILGSRRKLLSLFLVILSVSLVFQFAPETWFSRISTIESAGQDSSFMGRVASWNVNTAIALANPWFGGGFHGTNNLWIWQSFKTEKGVFDIPPHLLPEVPKAAHSIYFETLGDMGFVGLFLFLALLLNSIVTRFEIARMCSQIGNGVLWARDMADVLMISVIAYAVGGAGVSLAYFDLIYVMAMLLEVIKQCVRNVAVPRPTIHPLSVR